MATIKQAGTERPYTYQEFMRLVEKTAKEQQVPFLDQLDYMLGEWDSRLLMNDPYAEIYAITNWGGSEGIYTCLYIRNCDGDDKRIGCAKTLDEKDEDYIAMCTMGGHLCVIANRYIREHKDEFNWKDYDVVTVDFSGREGGYCQCTLERARELAQEKKREGMAKVYIRNNETREIEEV